eukprot:TRINITY_DN27539_c0_g1_i1.p2 TRINITY_DN27539_c0_g1~~TRINITY_DN27539_c0_g1_i1.p2  ORF type:complete len:189 (-),score=21.62 TRINITY_DN27539_c0_g1_i1:87-653(-)
MELSGGQYLVVNKQHNLRPVQIRNSPTLRKCGLSNRKCMRPITAVDPENAKVVIKSVSEFEPGPIQVGWEIYVGFLAGVFPFAIGLYEFVKRILIQVRCEVCNGSGLVTKGRFQKKCSECGGFFPWRGWGEFLSANANPGNGGVLRFPKGQTSVFFEVPPTQEKGAVQPEQTQKKVDKIEITTSQDEV